MKLVDINNEFLKVKNQLPAFPDFKKKNLAMAILAAKICGLKDHLIYGKIKKINDVNGRLELVKKLPNKAKVFLDYAHTPDALLKTLECFKNENKKNISIVFGCGGDRDKKKRPLMAKIANKYCSKIYITDDNPRNEDPQKIRKELLKYISRKKSFNIGNRRNAIQQSIKKAIPGEIILVAGKGHEEIQIYKNKTYKISDKKIIKGTIKKSKHLPKKRCKLGLPFVSAKFLLRNLLQIELLKSRRSRSFFAQEQKLGSGPKVHTHFF